ncbi:epididymal secretory protein E3-beta [Perognathus longimembris pacificus]|uniref:epididymal secretory protein E3-beta n=1 Tax=Perognathus longimembris pacificus TaxID=214514 RepID=UPI0020193CFD|nr:epididymal secretory protein E3-beta [Perognathus longimembris pacificus]
MASSLKVWGSLLALLCLQFRLPVHGHDISRKEFMAEHYLNPSQQFHMYRCDVLMREKALKHSTSHLFIYASWHKIKQVCNSVNWKKLYRNAYIWAQTPIKVLKCHWNSFTNSYREIRSYSYVQFHCNMDGYVKSIEDTKTIDPIYY